MNFYSLIPGENSLLQQGDLLADVPFSFFPIADAKVKLSTGGSTKRDLTRNSSNVEFISASVTFDWGLVLSQTCDLQPRPDTGAARKPILVARVRSIKSLVPNFNDTTLKATVSDVKKLATAGSAPTLLYLPEYQEGNFYFPRAGADLLDVQRFVPGDLAAVTRLIRLRLSEAALQALQERCAYCFGRYAAPDDLYYSAAESSEIQRQEDARRQSR